MQRVNIKVALSGTAVPCCVTVSLPCTMLCTKDDLDTAKTKVFDFGLRSYYGIQKTLN